jgi:hypothetical protein
VPRMTLALLLKHEWPTEITLIPHACRLRIPRPQARFHQTSKIAFRALLGPMSDQ